MVAPRPRLCAYASVCSNNIFGSNRIFAWHWPLQISEAAPMEERIGYRA